jgi:hypothetical protein
MSWLKLLSRPLHPRTQRCTACSCKLNKDSITQRQKIVITMTHKVPLKDMNDRNARFAKWEVALVNSEENSRSYMYQGKARSVVTYTVIIVDPDDNSVYCKGVAKKTQKNATAYHAAKAALADGAYLMSNVVFEKDTSTKWLGGTKKVVVDLLLTKLDKIDKDVSAVQPAPTTKISGCKALGSQQCFDLTALISSVSPHRPAAAGSKVFDVLLRDASLSLQDKPMTLPLTVYTAEDNVQSQHDKFERFLATKQPVTITQIAGQQKEGKYEFKTTNGWTIFASSSVKAISLTASADAVLEATEVDSFELIKKLTEKDWSTIDARESNCYLLKQFLSRHTSLNSMDNEETVWQVNWATVVAPAAVQSITTNDGSRIWFETVFRDLTGWLSIWVTEKAALMLADLTDPAEFRQTHTDGHLWFASYVSVKIVRRPTEDADHPFKFMVVDASIQSFDQPPTSESCRLLPLLDASAEMNEACLPVTLNMVYKSEHYPMLIHYSTQPLPAGFEDIVDAFATVKFTRPAANIVALIVANNKGASKTIETDGGFMLTTTVSDYPVSATGNAEQPARYNIRSYCTLDNVKDFKMEPLRGQKQQVALVMITGLAASDEATDAAKEFVVDSVQLLSDDQAIQLQHAFQKLIYYSTLVSQQPPKERLKMEHWNESDSPMSAKKCRRLGKAPTGDELPAYKLFQ